MSTPVISVQGLRKSYRSVEAVRGIDLEVTAGEVFAFLGPNGAGKTTTVEILEGYRDRSAGEVWVLGQDPQRAGRAWRSRIGVVLQESELERTLTVAEALSLYAGYYPSPRPVAETMAVVGLTEQADQRTGRLSGGQRRRLDVGLALVGDPELLFLDEPTTGFDPAARRGAWEMIANLARLGKTVFLTTHYMDEAQFLADRVAIISGGVIVAEGTPGSLGSGRELSSTLISFGLGPDADPVRVPAAVASKMFRVPGSDLWQLRTTEPVADLAALCIWALDTGVDLVDLQATRPSLEDVYLRLTGSGPDDGGGAVHADPASAEVANR